MDAFWPGIREADTLKKHGSRSTENTADERRRGPRTSRDLPGRGGPRTAPRDAPGRSANQFYGLMPVLELLRSNPARVDRILVADGVREHRLNDIYSLARENSIRIERIPREALERSAGTDANTQGVLAIVGSSEYARADELLDKLEDPALLVILDGVEDPRNLGAVLRSAECAGAGGVIIPDRRAAGLTETVAKSSAGASAHLPVAKVPNLNRLIEDLKERRIWVVGAAGEAETEYTEWDWTQPTALVLGAEGSGLHRLVRDNCDVLVRIPVYGKIDSLNISVAAGVILFEARRQRRVGERKGDQ